MASSANLQRKRLGWIAYVVAGQNVTYRFNHNQQRQLNPAAASVTDSLPSGLTFSPVPRPATVWCIGTTPAASFYLLQSGEAQTVTIVAQTSLSIPDGTATTNTVSISNSSAVDLRRQQFSQRNRDRGPAGYNHSGGGSRERHLRRKHDTFSNTLHRWRSACRRMVSFTLNGTSSGSE